MIYAHLEVVDNRIATLVVAADSFKEYDEFIDTVQGQSPKSRNFVEIYQSQMLEHLTDELYKGYKRQVNVFYHKDESQQTKFLDEWGIRVVKSAAGRDRHEDMLFNEKKRKLDAEKQKANAVIDQIEDVAERIIDSLPEDATMEEYQRELELHKQHILAKNGVSEDEVRPRTIAELHGLDKEDPWDRRSPEEKAAKRAEAEAKAKAGKLNPQVKAGEISGDSFTGGKYDKRFQDDKGDVKVTDIHVTQNADGSFSIDKVLAKKEGGEVDEELKAQRDAEEEAWKAARKTFDPSDFAAVLRGDGGSDNFNIAGDPAIRNQTAPVARPSLSDAAEQAKREAKAAAEAQKVIDEHEQARKEADLKEKQERDQGIFKGTDLIGDETIAWDDLPNGIKSVIEGIGCKGSTVPLKNYPFNSELAGKAIIPFENPDAGRNGSVVTLAGSENANILGTVSMGDVAAAVVGKIEPTEPAWVVMERKSDSDKSVTVVRIR